MQFIKQFFWWLFGKPQAQGILMPRCIIDSALFKRDMKVIKEIGYDPYNSFDAVSSFQEDIAMFDEEYATNKRVPWGVIQGHTFHA
jgi:hypothetical protein